MVRRPVILRPYGVVIGGELELGVELLIEDGRVAEIRPHTGIPEPFVVSPAFVNAHSHLEYRGFQGNIDEPEYWGWIRELTRRKGEQTGEQIRTDCHTAARENRATGVALIAEHNDRPFAGEAMAAANLEGAILQELITFNEHLAPKEKIEKVRTNALENRQSFGGPIWLSPHAYHTVDRQTLAWLASTGDCLSIHVAETEHETAFTRHGKGPIANFYRSAGVRFEPTGDNIVGTLADLGYLREGVQFVHCCAIEEGDLSNLATSGVSIAHCPRSNTRLRCPAAPVREMLEAGIPVGIGLDSAASSGPIDMFEEMREALRVSVERGRPLVPEEVWRMATGGGFRSIRPLLRSGREIWDVAVGSDTPLIKIGVPDALSIDDLIERGRPELVDWL